MGHLINPVTFRLSQTHFWNSTWNCYNKINYTKIALEDLNFKNLVKWLYSWSDSKKYIFKILDYRIVRNFNNLIINFFMIMNEDYTIDNGRLPDTIYKKYNYEEYIRRWRYFQLWPRKKESFGRCKKKFFNLNLTWELKKETNKKSIYSYCLNYKPFPFLKLKRISLARARGSFLNYYLKKFCAKIYRFRRFRRAIRLKRIRFTLYIRLIRKGIFTRTKIIRYVNRKWSRWEILRRIKRYSFQIFVSRRRLLISYLKRKKKKKLVKITPNIFFSERKILYFKRVLNFFKKFLEFLIKKVFSIKHIILFFFEKETYRFKTKFVKYFMKKEVLKGYRVNHLMHLLRKDFLWNKSIIGFKLSFFGRYRRRLRNRDMRKSYGALAPSNHNCVVSYENFVVLLKQGITGVEISMIKKMEKNAIF